MSYRNVNDTDNKCRCVYLISDEKKYKTTKHVLHDLYLNKLLLHPDQIQQITLTQISDMNKQYLSIQLILRSAPECDLFMFKLLNESNKKLRLNPQYHPQSELLKTLHSKLVIINFASNARGVDCFNYNRSKLVQTLTPCIISRWKGLSIINTKTENKCIQINIPIEPYHMKRGQQNDTNYIADLHKLPKPYVLTFNIFAENISQITQSSNDEIKGYEINLNSIPTVNKLRTMHKINVDKSDNKSPLICSYNDGYCPKQNDELKPCPYEHLLWLESGVDDGNEDIAWKTLSEYKSVSAALICFDFDQEFNVESAELINVLQYCSVLRIEFITTQNEKCCEIFDELMQKICVNTGQIKTLFASHKLRIPYPSGLSLFYYTVYKYGTRSINNIYSLKSYLAKWNDNNCHNIAFALKACLTNWPKIFIPEDINDILLTQIEQDFKLFSQTFVMQILRTISHCLQFRHKYVNNFSVTPSEIYFNAKQFTDNHQMHRANKENMYYALKCIAVLPFHIELNIKYIAPTQIFANNSDEGRAYAKLQFICDKYENQYRPYHFAEDSDTLAQAKNVLSDGVIIAGIRYNLLWFGASDCLKVSVTMISQQLLPAGYTLCGLRIKYNLNKMLNQQYRMKHISSLQSSAKRMKETISFQCISFIKQTQNNSFDGCGLINNKWLAQILKQNENKHNGFPCKHAQLQKLSRHKLANYLYENGYKQADKIHDKFLLIEMVKDVQQNRKRRLRGQMFDNTMYADHGEMDDFVSCQPIEAQIGDIQCILVPYPQSIINQIIAENGNVNSSKNAYIFLPQNIYKQLCVFEYQRHYNGQVLFFDDDSDEDVKNAEEWPVDSDNEMEDENKPLNEEDALITMMRKRGIFADYLLNELSKTMKTINCESDVLLESKLDKEILSGEEIEFLNGEIPSEYAYYKLVSSNDMIPFYIHQDTNIKRCQLLSTSHSLINILQYHRKKDDELQGKNKNENVEMLKKALKQMIIYNKDMMDVAKLKKSINALTFLEIHNEMELHAVISNKYDYYGEISENSLEFKRLMAIRERIWRRCCVSLEIPILSGKYELSRRMIAICDHTNTLANGQIFIQLKTNRNNSNSYFSPPHNTKIIVRETQSLSPLSLQLFESVTSTKLAKLFPNQNILIFAAKNKDNKNTVASLSKTSNKNDSSYLNEAEYGRAKLFDCIICSDNNNINVFMPSLSSNIKRTGFDHGLALQRPINNKYKNEQKYGDEYEYEYDEEEEDDVNNEIFWKGSTTWIWDKNIKILRMKDYVEYFLNFNKNNYCFDLAHLFEIESQQNIYGMDSQKCRHLMKLNEHYNKLMEMNYCVSILPDKMYKKTQTFPHYMLNKQYSLRKQVKTVCGYLFDQILELLPLDLRNNILFLNKCGLFIDKKK